MSSTDINHSFLTQLLLSQEDSLRTWDSTWAATVSQVREDSSVDKHLVCVSVIVATCKDVERAVNVGAAEA